MGLLTSGRVSVWLHRFAILFLVLAVHALLVWRLWQLPAPIKPTPEVVLSMSWDAVPPPPSVAQESKVVPAPVEPVLPVIEDKKVAASAPIHQVRRTPAKPIQPVPVATTAPTPSEVVAHPTVPVEQSTPKPAEVVALVSMKAEVDYLQNPKPAYPRLSRRLGEEGEVRLKVQVGVEGQVLQVSVVRSSGYDRLDEAALNAVRSWRFKAAMRGDQAVSSWVEIPVKFTLEEE